MKAVASWRSQLQLFYKCPHYSSVGKEMTVLLQHMECSSVLLIFQKALFSCATVRQLSFQNITVLMLLKEDIILMKHLDYSKPVPVLIESVVMKARSTLCYKPENANHAQHRQYVNIQLNKYNYSIP